MSDLIVEPSAGVGRITLNRPHAINALTLKMCRDLHETLLEWAGDAKINSVEFRGAGERGFCAGADVRQLRRLVLDSPDDARAFFAIEYELDALIASYPKPITSYMSGITMGGGMGLSMHTPMRIADETTVIAMPETTIGMFPDVGSLFELSRAPGEVGTYLAMSGAHIGGASARFAGLVDQAPGDPAASVLAGDQGWIDDCFTGDDAALILRRLRSHPDQRARAAGADIAAKSPLSVCVALAAIRRAASAASVGEVLATDLTLANSFVDGSDFVEGVRARLVDKDRQPHWRHRSVAEVPAALVESMFVS